MRGLPPSRRPFRALPRRACAIVSHAASGRGPSAACRWGAPTELAVGGAGGYALKLDEELLAGEQGGWAGARVRVGADWEGEGRGGRRGGCGHAGVQAPAARVVRPRTATSSRASPRPSHARARRRLPLLHHFWQRLPGEQRGVSDRGGRAVGADLRPIQSVGAPACITQRARNRAPHGTPRHKHLGVSACAVTPSLPAAQQHCSSSHPRSARAPLPHDCGMLLALYALRSGEACE